MRLKREFYKLPVRFDVARMVEEVSGFSEEEWREHPHKYPGNTAMVLISVRGELNDDIAGPMAVTEKLRRCPYLQQVLASFNTVFGRSRLMRLAPGAEVSTHNDVHYYWRNRVRIHIPIITDPAVRFFCGEKSVHMAAGEAWIFDSWKPHRVINPAAHHRIHLVADTVGPGSFTGLRVGVTTAKTLAYSVGADILGVDTLETIAARAPRSVKVLSVAMDAQRGDVVARQFERARDGWLWPTGPAVLIAAEAWVGSLAPGTCVSGPVLRKLADQLPEGAVVLDGHDWAPSAAAVGRLAVRDYRAGRRDDVWSLVPRYSRRSAAEEKWEKRQRKPTEP